MDSHPKWRLRAHAALEAYFRERSFSRLTLALLVTVAGFAGFLISHFLLYGACLDVFAPNSHSIGPALKEIFPTVAPR
ncbi:MAG: hypothetical protein ABI600_10775 [Luteolibacter sp.]